MVVASVYPPNPKGLTMTARSVWPLRPRAFAGLCPAADCTGVMARVQSGLVTGPNRPEFVKTETMGFEPMGDPGQGKPPDGL